MTTIVDGQAGIGFDDKMLNERQMNVFVAVSGLRFD